MARRIFLFIAIGTLITVIVCSAQEPGDEFVAVHESGNYFVLEGKPFYFSGANAYFLWFGTFDCENDPREDRRKYCIPELFDDAVEIGFTVIRTWGFGEVEERNQGATFGLSFQPNPGEYDEDTFRHFDRVIYEASQKGLKLLVVLVNNWRDYGGMCKYVQWCSDVYCDNCSVEDEHCSHCVAEHMIDNPLSCSFVDSVHDEFYSNECTRTLYKNYVRYVLNRENSITGVKYKDDPTILGWELANEPRARSDHFGQKLNSWVFEMSWFIKAEGAQQLVAIGMDGGYIHRDGHALDEWWYNGSEGQDFVSSHQWDTVDFATFHFYRGMDRTLDAHQWIEEHVSDARNILHKPVVLEEFGESREVADFEAFLIDMYETVEEQGIQGDMIWMLCTDAFQESEHKYITYPDHEYPQLVDFIKGHADRMNKKFIRGDVNEDSSVDISDAIGILLYLFRAREIPTPIDRADVNGDDTVDISDVVYLLQFLFQGGPHPVT